MPTNGTRGYHPGLVDLASGHVSREIFVNDDIYAQEQERVFARSWLFVGHESQIPEPGDFFASRMGEELVISAATVPARFMSSSIRAATAA